MRTVKSKILLAAAFVWLTLPQVATAAGGESTAHAGQVLFALALLLLAAKAGGFLAERLGQPAVLGELLVGIGCGYLLPLFFEARGILFVRSDPTLHVSAEIGVLILLFDVGLETDVRSLARVGWSALVAALLGVAVPILLGWAAAAWLLPDSPTLAHVFVGATLSATSIGITSRILKDLGVMQSREGQIILGAALIDDVLGLVVLAVVTGAVAAATAGTASLSALAIGGILLRAVVFLGITVGLGQLLSESIVRLVARTGKPDILLVIGLSLCFILARAAELIGLAGIIGAFAAGLMLDPYGQGVRTRENEAALSELMHPLSALFVPLFFILMGIQVDVMSLASPEILSLGAVLIVCALAGKLVCGMGVLGGGVNRLAIGIGMIPRGEVGLIFAGIGVRMTLGEKPLLTQGMFSAIVLMVLVTTLLAPVGLRWAFSPPRTE
ncbi:MAG: cation:proton antiporter [Deltaproteobacteria bacterium]